MNFTEKEFFDYEMSHGVHMDNPDFVTLCNATARLVKDKCDKLKMSITSVLDYGAGMGVYSKAFKEIGYDVKIFEIFEPHRNYISSRLPQIEIVNEPITTDLMLFIEVSEHMTDEQLNNLFTKIKPRYILHSSTPHENPGFDEDWGHINIKKDWDPFFNSFGYEKAFDVNLPTEWTKFYKSVK